jgi:hypothetical protein
MLPVASTNRTKLKVFPRTKDKEKKKQEKVKK